MFSNFFIDRPIFATVISIFILLAGVIALRSLPIAEYPQLTAPTIQVSATYPGATAQQVEQSVAMPIEEQVNGAQDMMYMSSSSTNTGQMTLIVTFALNRDPDLASVREVLTTLLIAFGLVFLVVYVFLQNWRATLIPAIAVPVSLIGATASFTVLGFSLNTLTLFGLVLAIGLVVDDAIVDVVCFGKLDLVSGEKSLQKIFGSLLAVESNDFSDTKIIRRFRCHPPGHFQISLGFFIPLAKQRLDLRIKLLHR